jgi:hypothetical protein
MKRWLLVFILLTLPLFARDGQRDFDSHIGTWKTHVRRLVKPLTGSTTWVELNGTSVVREVLDGARTWSNSRPKQRRGSGMSLRFSPEAEQWSIHFASSHDGDSTCRHLPFDRTARQLSRRNLGGRAIFVRFVITPVDANTIRFEQAFSNDGGKTWEVNWIATDTRLK